MPAVTQLSATPPQDSFQFFTSQLQTASKQLLPLKQRNQCKPWIQEDTLRAPEAARQAEAQTLPNSKTLRNQAKRKARKDRVNSQMVHNWLKEDPSRRFWNTVKSQRKGLQGKFSQRVVNGKPVPWTKTQDAVKTHLEQSQSAAPDIPDHTSQKRQARSPTHPMQEGATRSTGSDLLQAIIKPKSPKLRARTVWLTR